jgi:hypothetical protein
LRKKGEAVLDAKYQGKKGSRAALYGDDSEEEEQDGEEDDEDIDSDEADGLDAELGALLDGGEDYESEEDEGGFEDLEGEDGAEGATFGPGGASAFASEEEEDDEEEEQVVKKPVKEQKARVSKDDRAMVKQLKQAASADVEKGRDVKKQLVRLSFFHPPHLSYLLTSFFLHPFPIPLAGLLRLPPLLPYRPSKSRPSRQLPPDSFLRPRRLSLLLCDPGRRGGS